MLSEKIKKLLKKQHYETVGNNSAVQICLWTKNSLNKKGVCWKEKFYGIKSHRCCQFSPAVMWCHNQCLHCWRPIENNLGTKMLCPDKPEDILENIIQARKKLMIGFKGNKNVDEKTYKEAINPTLFTFSLSGEPTLYPYIGDLIKEIRKRKAISFLVTNGLEPEKIKELEKENTLPSQLTLSMNTPNEELFKIWHRSMKKNAWEEFNKTLEIINKLKGKTRRVVRLTLVREDKNKKESFIDNLSNMEEEHVKEYATLIKKAEPDFIHVKGFKSLGYSRERMGYDKMPFHEEVKIFSKKLAKELKDLGYKILGEHEYSCVVLLGKDKKKMKIKESEI